MDTTHQTFLANLRRSVRAVDRVADYLAQFGYRVTVNALVEAPERAQWRDYADHGDIEIVQRIEVKRLSRPFTGPEDWPFHGKFIVCARHSFDNAKPKPLAYYILSADMEAFACVMVESTSKRWTVEKRKDVRYGDYWQEFYLCPLELVKWGRLK